VGRGEEEKIRISEDQKVRRWKSWEAGRLRDREANYPENFGHFATVHLQPLTFFL